MSDTWTIGELAEHAARALRDGAPPAPVNGRVRDVPGERLIRWYTTIGLVDPPLTRRGRIARYGRRHLLQLVAVKRLQAEGRSIAQIQAALAGATDPMLEAAARLGDLAEPGSPGPAAAAAVSPVAPFGAAAADDVPTAEAPARARFWAERPAAGNERPAGSERVTGATSVVAGVRLGDGVRLVLDAVRVPSEQDVQAVLAAAGPLLAVLEERKLI
ncbi:MerR family transcriptional regulator [Nonomuraea sp. NPDC050643]|uniref:helix-turn-helix domain-containing protein n=1 Tax=Nonomuraea sp. NPDC050643 TaxID=3155660 RepID=UPI0034115008